MNDILYTLAKSYLGLVLLATDSQGICALFMGNEQEMLQDLNRRFPKAKINRNDKVLEALSSQVIHYLDHPQNNMNFTLSLQGTEFQQSVWKQLAKIPCGKTWTYKDIAENLGNPKSVRAVAQACGANPVAILVPCHRVIASNGALSGYYWGVDIKQKLLQRENVSNFKHK
jgi:AraC family transcriptional regulator of adaptative response/methylated-DNA-[protein]-cysteine methyltransferase